jgi:predicted CXXCH cytochrome family protein
MQHEKRINPESRTSSSLCVLSHIHAAKGLSCADCHGGDRTKEDMEEAMDPDAGFVGVPEGDDISATCSACHSDASVMVRTYNSTLNLDQFETLQLSVHGQQSLSSGERIAQCTSCHGSHGILPTSNRRSPVHPRNIPATCAKCHSDAAYMSTYDQSIPVDQLQKYRTSIHGQRNRGGDVKVAECASCHGSHEILAAKDVRSKVYPINLPETCGSCHSDATYMRGYGIDSDQLELYSKSVHGVALLENQDIGAPACNDCHGNHGAAPPGVESISKVCGTCHALNADLFSKSPHEPAFDAQGLPECETCHGNHEVVATTDALLGVEEGAVCAWCHGDDPDSKGYMVASTFRQLADSLGAVESDILVRIEDVEQKGMEVSEALFKAREVRQARLESRTKVHSFNEEQFTEVIEKGLSAAAEVREHTDSAVEEYYFRRWGLVWASLIITILAVSLYLLIIRIEKEQSAS